MRTRSIVALCFFLNTIFIAKVAIGHDYCRYLYGTWQGIYTDHGPYDSTLPLKLSWYITPRGKVIGATIPLPSSQHPVQLTSLYIYGMCRHNTLAVYFLNSQFKPACGTLSKGIVSKGSITLDLHWQNAMTGGHGPLKLHKVSHKVMIKPQIKAYLNQKTLKITSCH